jgi:menaquinone-9 beta-reductase
MSDRAERRASYDVVVVGGRVAGSITAALMASAGMSVLVVDRARFPSPTLSTHFFRGDHLVRVIDRIGALDAVLAHGSPQLVHEYNFEAGGIDASRSACQSPGAVGYCLSTRRVPLDATLLEQARRSGAQVLSSTVAVGALMERDRARGVELADGSTVRATLVVGADGCRSRFAGWVGADDVERHSGMRALYFRYVEGMTGPGGRPPDGAEFSLLGDELGYVFPSDSGLTCVAISVNRSTYDQVRHDAQAGFEELLHRHRGIWDRYAEATPRSRLYAWGMHDDYVRRAAGPGWALVGDAGIHQDPWSGAGMDTAGVCAELLADCVVSAGGPAADWSSAYQQARDDTVLEWFRDTVAGAHDLEAFFS